MRPAPTEPAGVLCATYCGRVRRGACQRDDLPQRRQADQDVHHACEHRVLTAEQRGDEIKLECADQPPVQATDDQQYQRHEIQAFHCSSLSVCGLGNQRCGMSTLSMTWIT